MVIRDLRNTAGSGATAPRVPGVASTLALCMVVKNEQEFLGRCLNSVTGIVNEILIVDTGSTDRTIEIAESYGARVIESPWCDDFSVVRNVGLENIRSDWVLQLDADEELAPGFSVQPLLSDSRFDGYQVRIIVAASAYEMDTKDPESFAAVRLFRSRKDMRYKSPIHEYIDFPDSGRIGLSGLMIVHFGPVLDKESDHQARLDRNFKMLSSAVEKHPEDPYLYFCLGSEFFLIQDYEAAIACYQRSVSLVSNPNLVYVPSMMRNTAACLVEMGEPGKALELLKDLQGQFPLFTDVYFLEGEIAMRQGDYVRGERVFRHCLKMGEPPAELYSWGGTGGWRAQQGLDDARLRLGIGGLT